jgi:hypothetical protein
MVLFELEFNRKIPPVNRAVGTIKLFEELFIDC